ncbi:hypothetical protein AGMMS50239_18730 [Bacteroidia bacterium]|nr:hypothetical protein AGMMS50239_18730 [Bacteroidia bacterium]
MQKKLVLLLLLSFVGLNFHLFAQDDKKKAEFESFKIRRIGFITKAMNLTTDEAKVFWPLCNELQEKKFSLNQRVRRAIREFNKAEKEGKTHTQEEYLNLIKLAADIQVQEAKLDQEYITKFAEVIPAQKIFLYQEAERQFAREMLVQQWSNHPK